MVDFLQNIKSSKGICKGCIIGKHPKHKFNRGKASRASCILGLIQSDICSPLINTYTNGSMYFITSIDDFSRITWVCFLKNKSKVFERFKNLKGFVETATRINIKAIRYDIGREYISSRSFYNFVWTIDSKSITQSPTHLIQMV